MLRHAPIVAAFLPFSSLHCPKLLLKPSSLYLNIFKLPSFSSSTPLSMSSRSVSDVLMAAARAAASKSKKRKTQDDGATTNKNPNPTPPSKDAKPTAQPKEEEKPTLCIDDKIAALRKKLIDFKPHSAAFWKDGESIPFLFLARVLDLIEGETGRIVITEILCNVYKPLSLFGASSRRRRRRRRRFCARLL